MKRWLEQHGKAIQSLGALVTMLAAVVALVGVKVQIDANARQQREQSARDIYREFLNLSISKPEFADPNYCAIKGSANEVGYENFVEYMLYTADQLLGVSREWEPTINEHLMGHRDYLCSEADWSDDSPEIRGLIDRFKAKECKAFRSGCES